jgi:hypothetical protein
MNGLKAAFQGQRNLRIQGTIALFTIALGIGLKITRMEWAIIFTCIGLVMGLELLNLPSKFCWIKSILKKTLPLAKPKTLLPEQFYLPLFAV